MFLPYDLTNIYSKRGAYFRIKVKQLLFELKYLIKALEYRLKKYTIIKRGIEDLIFKFYQNTDKYRKKKTSFNSCQKRFLVPWAGIEPAHPKILDFESSASTNSATKAFLFRIANL